MEHIDLEEFADGALSAQVNKAMEEVTKNIQDPNTSSAVARKITVTIAFKANDARDFVTAGVITKTTLAPSIGAVTAFSMGKDLKTGKVAAVEVGKQIPGQLSLEVEEQERNESERYVDMETGEILEPASNLLDLRRRQG